MRRHSALRRESQLAARAAIALTALVLLADSIVSLWTGLYLNLGTRKFLEVSGVSGIDSISDGRAAVFADFDNDGDLDVFLTTIQGQTHLLFRNNVGQAGNYVRVSLEGTSGLGLDAYGAIVRLRTSSGVLTKIKVRVKTARAMWWSIGEFQAACSLAQ